MTAPTTQAHLEAALQYARMGWHVAPGWGCARPRVCSCPKGAGCKDAGKHPWTAHGLKDATTSDPHIRQWWGKQCPGANIIVATGGVSGFDVLDVDLHSDGPDGAAALAALEREHGELPLTVEQLTGGGGRHVLFRHAEGVTNKTGALPLGLHVRGDGGYILVEPSNHVSGGTYHWNLDNHPDEVELAKWPVWLLALVRQASPGKNGHPKTNDAPEAPILEGNRDNHLTSLAGSMRHRGMSAEEILAGLQAVNDRRCQPPLDQQALKRIAWSVGRYAPAPVPAFGFGQVDASTPEPPAPPGVSTRRPTTDAGMAERLEDRGVALLWDVSRSCYRTYIDGTWELALRGEPERHVIETARSIVTDEAAQADKEQYGALLKCALKYESNKSIGAVLELYRVLPGKSVTAQEWDRDHYLLNLRNGTLDLHDGTLRPHRPEDRITRWVDIDSIPGATCPRWQQFLQEVFLERAELIEFVRRAVGYSLTGSIREQVFFFLHGFGANGKSVFLAILSAVLGPYAHACSFDTFLVQYGNQIRADLAAMAGARVALASEPPAERAFDDALLKSLTGGEQITTRFLHANFFTYSPTFKLWLSANHEPPIRGQDYAIWRRVRKIPFDATFPPEKQDRNLVHKLRGGAVRYPGVGGGRLPGLAAGRPR